MTFREKLMQEHPEHIDEKYSGGCFMCPESFEYEKYFDCATAGVNCTECWDREIPEEQTKPIEEPKGESKMKNISRIVEEALADSISQNDIEEAVANIIDGMEIADLLAESDTLRDAVYTAVSERINSVIEMYL